MTQQSYTRYGLIVAAPPSPSADFDVIAGGTLLPGFGYDATLTVTDIVGNTDSVTKHVTVDQTGYTAFKDKSTGMIKYFKWEFGDEKLSQLQSPVHVYTKPVIPTPPPSGPYFIGWNIPAVVLPPTIDEMAFIGMGRPDGYNYGYEFWGKKLRDMWATDNWSDPDTYHRTPDWNSYGEVDMVVQDNGTLVFYHAGTNRVYNSVDNGFSWTMVAATPTGIYRRGARMVRLPGDKLILASGSNVSQDVFYNDVWQSIDNGASWSVVNNSTPWPGRREFNLIAATSVTHPEGYLYLMGGRYEIYYVAQDMWRSYDGGVNWEHIYGSTATNIPAYYYDIFTGDWYNYVQWYTYRGGFVCQQDINSTLVFVNGHSWWVYKSENEGGSWIKICDNPTGLSESTLSMNRGRVWFGMLYIPPVSSDAPNGRLFIINGYEAWYWSPEDNEGSLPGVFESLDMGYTWTYIRMAITN